MSSPSTVKEDWLGLNSTWEENFMFVFVSRCTAMALGSLRYFLSLQCFLSPPWQLKWPPQAAARPVLPYTCTNSRSPSCSLPCQSGSSVLPGFPEKTEPSEHFRLSQPEVRRKWAVGHIKGRISARTNHNLYGAETCSVFVQSWCGWRSCKLVFAFLKGPEPSKRDGSVTNELTHTLNPCTISLNKSLVEWKLNAALSDKQNNVPRSQS